VFTATVTLGALGPHKRGLVSNNWKKKNVLYEAKQGGWCGKMGILILSLKTPSKLAESG